MIQVVRPGLHHSAAFGNVLGIVINCSDSISFSMRKLAFNGIATPPQLIEQRGGHAPKPVRCHIVRPVTQPTERCVQRVVTHWALGGALTREEEETRAG